MNTNKKQIDFQIESRGVVNPTLNPKVTSISAFQDIIFNCILLIKIRDWNLLNLRIFGVTIWVD